MKKVKYLICTFLIVYILIGIIDLFNIKYAPTVDSTKEKIIRDYLSTLFFHNWQLKMVASFIICIIALFLVKSFKK